MKETLLNTLEAPGEFDALTTLRPGEPYFLLVGRDKLAPTLVLQWAQANRERALDEHDRGLTNDEEHDLELRKSTQAEEIAWSMQAYKKGHVPKEGRDRDGGERASAVSRSQLPEDQQQRDKEHRTRNRISAVLNEAVSELAELERLVPGETSLGMAATNGIANLQALVEAIRIKRPSIDRDRS